MPKAKYEGIYRSIKKRIEAQDYPYQSLLPSENTLIAEYDCSRNTVRRALAEKPPAAIVCMPLPASFGLRPSPQRNSLPRKADFLRAMNCGRYSVCVIWTEKH